MGIQNSERQIWPMETCEIMKTLWLKQMERDKIEFLCEFIQFKKNTWKLNIYYPSGVVETSIRNPKTKNLPKTSIKEVWEFLSTIKEWQTTWIKVLKNNKHAEMRKHVRNHQKYLTKTKNAIRRIERVRRMRRIKSNQ